MFGLTKNVNTLLMTDFYKCCHMNMYDPKVKSMTSYLVPRSSRLPEINEVMFFGLTNFIKKYLIDDFNNSFFKQPWEVIEKQYYEMMGKSLRYTDKQIKKTADKVKELHNLGFLPIEINAVAEGTLVPMGIPCVEIRSTNKNFPWVAQAIESLLSCSIWHPMVSATVGYQYLKVARNYSYCLSKDFDVKNIMCDFSMRGQESMESAIASSMGWLTSWKNSSTVPAREAIKYAYPETKEDFEVYGLTSTEHSVMTTDFAVNGNERETYRKLLTEIYPDVSFAAVCDSYDFWNILTNVLPTLKDEINQHKGFIGVRHDSADPVTALCGIPEIRIPNELFQKYAAQLGGPEGEMTLEVVEEDKIALEELISEALGDIDYETPLVAEALSNNNKEVIITIEAETTKSYRCMLKAYRDYENDICDFQVNVEGEPTWEDKGMVQTIYEIFGGSLNDKGYKVCNPHIKAVYGDSITIQRAEKIFNILTYKGFSIENVSLGVGSFSFEALEDQFGNLLPFTRDTFSIAIKCTYAQIEDENGNLKGIPVFKDPKGFSGKKSNKGLCYVYRDEKTSTIKCEDGYLDWGSIPRKNNVFKNYFFEGCITDKHILDFENVRTTVNYQFNTEN